MNRMIAMATMQRRTRGTQGPPRVRIPHQDARHPEGANGADGVVDDVAQDGVGALVFDIHAATGGGFELFDLVGFHDRIRHGGRNVGGHHVHEGLVADHWIGCGDGVGG